MVMKNLLFLTLLCFSFNAFATKWVPIKINGIEMPYYVDVANITKKRDLVYFWKLWNHPHITTLVNISGSKSHLSKVKLDCGSGEYSVLAQELYADEMCNGKKVMELGGAKPSHARPDTQMGQVIKFVCKYTK